MGRLEKDAEIDMADGTEDPPIGAWIAVVALEKWELLDRARSKRNRDREAD